MTEKSIFREENLIEKALQWIDKNHRVAIATVISTWGSSPRPVGSQMVVNDQEEFQGSVSGGCIESTILTEAQFVIKNDEPQRLRIGIDNRVAWDTGLGCGGDIDIYIEPVISWQNTLVNLSKLMNLKHPCCMITNLSTGAKNLFCPNFSNKFSQLDGAIRSASEYVIASGKSSLVEEDGVEYFLHGLMPAQELIVGGAVHIAQALVQMAQLLGYQCTIIDPRTKYATEERFPGTNLIVEHPKKALQNKRLHSSSSVVALSHSPNLDDPILAHALNENVEYIGALGSKKTHADRINRLQKSGFSIDQLKKIHGPIGLDIGSETPGEIALAIMAEITQKRRKGNINNFKNDE